MKTLKNSIFVKRRGVLYLFGKSHFFFLLQVTAISMQSVLIGSELGGCAFVCGSLSFLDKMSCGLALYVLQSHQSKFCFFLT